MNYMDEYLDAMKVYLEAAERFGEDHPQTQLALAKAMDLAPTRHWVNLSNEEQNHE